MRIQTLHPLSPGALLATLVVMLGFDSGAALATVVGVPVEVPVMLSVVKIANAARGWCQHA
jgi:ACR3 family arsenite transporter